MIDIIIFSEGHCTPLFNSNKVWIEVKETYFEFFDEDFETYPFLIKSLSKAGFNFKKMTDSKYKLDEDHSLFLKLKVNNNFIEISIEE